MVQKARACLYGDVARGRLMREDEAVCGGEFLEQYAHARGSFLMIPRAGAGTFSLKTSQTDENLSSIEGLGDIFF